MATNSSSSGDTVVHPDEEGENGDEEESHRDEEGPESEGVHVAKTPDYDHPDTEQEYRKLAGTNGIHTHSSDPDGIELTVRWMSDRFRQPHDLDSAFDWRD